MLKSAFSISIIFLLLQILACQQTKDKELGYGASPTADSQRIKLLIATGKKFQNGSVDSLPGIAWELESISRFRGNKTGVIYAAIFKANYYWYTVDYATAMKMALDAMDVADKWKVHKPIPEIYSIMANIHKENGNYDAAFKDCINGLNEAKNNRDTTAIISLLGLRAMFTHGYYRKNGRPNDDHTSLDMEFEALKVAESKPQYEQMRIRFYNNIGQTFKEQGNYPKALLYANKAVVLANKYHQPRSLTYSYNWIGEAYYYMGQRDKGIDYLHKAIAITRQIEIPYRQMEIYDAMYWCYMSTKNYEPAIACLMRTTKMRDSLQVAKNEKQIKELQLKYDAGKKDRKIARLSQQYDDNNRKMLMILISMTFFVISLVIILYQYLFIKRSNKLIKINNERLNDALLKIAYVQSHHVRRPLASIMGLMNIIKANNYEADKEVLQKMDEVANELDERIRAVIKETEVNDDD
ncbi:MAG: tetratricopeptide repeat protein [Bacteroidota bacterium]